MWHLNLMLLFLICQEELKLDLLLKFTESSDVERLSCVTHYVSLVKYDNLDKYSFYVKTS